MAWLKLFRTRPRSGRPPRKNRLHVREIFFKKADDVFPVSFRIVVIQGERSIRAVLRPHRDRNNRSATTTQNRRPHWPEARISSNILDPACLSGAKTYVRRVFVVLPAESELQVLQKTVYISRASGRLQNSPPTPIAMDSLRLSELK
jgi:hypothetical protein